MWAIFLCRSQRNSHTGLISIVSIVPSKHFCNVGKEASQQNLIILKEHCLLYIAHCNVPALSKAVVSLSWLVSLCLGQYLATAITLTSFVLHLGSLGTRTLVFELLLRFC